MDNKKRFNRIIRDIKEIKIQGARNIAKSALYACSLYSGSCLIHPEAKKKLVESRPTEPMLVNILHNYEKLGYKRTLEHFDSAQAKINKLVIRLIKNNSVIFTHCHSTNVISSLIYAKNIGKKFQVYNTETRPLFQGRKTASDLAKNNIKVTSFVDSGADIALKQVDLVFFGADAVLNDGIINKIGSGMIAELASMRKIPVYIIADSWKYSSHHVKIEERDFHEVWARVPRKIKVENPAFEKIPRKYIKAIVSELGILSYSEFLKKVRNQPH